MSNVKSIVSKLNRSQQQSVIALLTKASNLEAIEEKDLGWLGYSGTKLPKDDVLQIFKGDRKRLRIATRILSVESPVGIGYFDLAKVINAVITKEVASRVAEELEPKQILMVDPDEE